MSVSLVKKSLELISTENLSGIERPKKLKEQRSNKIKKKHIADKKKNAAILVQKLREKSKVNSEIDKVESNVQKLLNLSRTNTIQNKKLENKLLNKIQHKEESTANKNKNKSAFSEEDFAKFENEYFVN